MMLKTFLLISVVVLGPVYVCADTFIKSDDGDLAFSNFTTTGDKMKVKALSERNLYVHPDIDTFIKSDDGDLAFSNFTTTGDKMKGSCPKGYQQAELYTYREFKDSLKFLQDLEEKGTYDKALGVLIGLRRIKKSKRKNAFKWRSLHPFNFNWAFWATDEPNNVKNNENCVAYTLKKKKDTDKVGWNDVPCNISLNILCKKEKVEKSCDKCETGWKRIGTDCVKVMDGLGRTLDDAKNTCRQYDASIAIIKKDSKKYKMVLAKMKEDNKKYVWVMEVYYDYFYYYLDVEGHYQPVDGHGKVYVYIYRWKWQWLSFLANGVVCQKSC